MTKAASVALDRRDGKPGRKGWLPSFKIPWDLCKAWDYTQTNDQLIWADDPRIDGLIEADALFKSDPTEGFRRFLTLAEAGSVWAMLKVGSCFYRGRGVAPDPERAEYWYRRSCDAGCTRAMLDLGGILAVRGDLKGAEAVYRRGAADDWAPALCWTAWYQMKRSSTRESRNAARLLLERAAAKGSPGARWILAWCLGRGRFGVRGMSCGFKLMLANYAQLEELERLKGT